MISLPASNPPVQDSAVAIVKFLFTSISPTTESREVSPSAYIFAPILLQIAESGGVEAMIHNKEWFMNGIYSYKGYLTNSIMAKKYTVSFKDIKLLTASMF